MIEITHTQARRLLRASLDGRAEDRRRLPEGQWSALQAHLENCRDCRDYQERLDGLEKGLRRSARSALDVLPNPPENLPSRVLAVRAERARIRQRLVSAALPLLVALLFLAAAVPLTLPPLEPERVEAQAPVESTAVPQPTAMPTAEAGSFPAVIAYEARRGGRPDGDSEIYLLNPGSPPVSLSDDPAQDTEPVWSPDGQWLAFLSDRPTPDQPQGKVEVYVVSLASAEIVRLTAEPGLTWQGPLSWSPDGEWIALTAIREAQGGQSWVYLVPVNEREEGDDRPRALPGSRGGWSPEFAPYGDQLAYAFSDGDRSGLAIYHTEKGERARTSWPENPLAPDPPPGALFDWAYDGAGLAYIATDLPELASGEGSGEVTNGAGSQVVAVRAPDQSLALLDDPSLMNRIARSRWPGAYRAVTWMPRGAVVFLEDLADARARDNPQAPAGCLTVQSRSNRSGRGGGQQVSMGELCVEGGLDRASWTSDGRWLVALGRLPGENTRSLFALRVPGGRYDAQEDGSETTLLRLADDPKVKSLPRVRPRQRRSAMALRIDPSGEHVVNYGPPPSDLSVRGGGPRGKITYAVQNNTTGVVASSNPDGTGGQVLYSAPGVSRCPRWSPDGEWVALAHRAPPPLGADRSTTGVEELYIVDADGRGARRLTRSAAVPGVSRPEALEYSCPVWSPPDTPGGPYLAAVIEEPNGWLLALIPTQGGRTRYAAIGQPLPGMQPQWSPDGSALYLAAALPGDSREELLRVDLPESRWTGMHAQSLKTSQALENLSTFALAPDGQSIMAMERPPGQYSPAARLRRVRLTGSGVHLVTTPVRMRPFNLSGRVMRGDVAWLGRSVLGLVLHGEAQGTYKAGIYHYDLASHRSRGLVGVEDRLNSLAWSPDGRWLVYSSESGLWGLDVDMARRGLAGPVWLSPVPVDDLDWR